MAMDTHTSSRKLDDCSSSLGSSVWTNMPIPKSENWSQPKSPMHLNLSLWYRLIPVVLATTLSVGGLPLPTYAHSLEQTKAESVDADEDVDDDIQQGWDAALRAVQLVDDSSQSATALLLQFDIAEKPSTSYANAVYQVYALNGNQRQLLYSNRGARLIANEPNSVILPTEVIALSDLRENLKGFDLSTLSLEFVVQVRYDSQQARDQRVEWREVYQYSELSHVQSTQFYSTQTVYEVRQLILIAQTMSSVVVVEGTPTVTCALDAYPGSPANTSDNRYDRSPRGNDYSRSDLRNANFSNLNLEKAKFERSNLASANFSRANLNRANFKRAVLHRANLQYVYAEKAKFDEANLSCARLTHAYLSKAKFKKTDLRKADLRNANLRKAKLKEADLRGADLRGADLSHADFKEADLRGADLRDTNLNGTKFKDARLEGALLPPGYQPQTH